MMNRARAFMLVLAFSIGSAGCHHLKPSHHDTNQYTPVFAAAAACDLAAVQDAVAKDKSLLKAREWSGATLLHDSAGQNCLPVSQYLLDQGADVNAATDDGITPLHMAAQNGNIDLMKLLLEHGAKPDARDSKGWTPLDRAEKWNHPEAADYLRNYGK